jgi:hypothetical protein
MGETDDEADVFVSEGAPEFLAPPLLFPSISLIKGVNCRLPP